MNAIVRGVYGMVAVLGVGGIPRISQFSFPLSRVGEESLSESSDTDVLSASVGIRAQIVRPRLTKMMALLTVSSGYCREDEPGDAYSITAVEAKEPFACKHELCMLRFAATLQDLAIYQATLLGRSGSRWSGPA